jgi:hypothetical protein
MYQGLVYLHLIGLVLFLLAHSASMWAVFKARGARDREVVRTLLEMSSQGAQASYLGLLLLGIGGLGAAWNANFLTTPWAIASYVVVVIVLVGMYAMGTGFYAGVRESIMGSEKVAAVGDDEVFAALQNRRPEILAAIGLIGLLMLVYLMTFRPT